MDSISDIDCLASEVVPQVEPGSAAPPVEYSSPGKTILPLCRLWLTPTERRIKPMQEMTPEERSRFSSQIKSEQSAFLDQFRKQLGGLLIAGDGEEMEEKLSTAVERYHTDAKDLYARLVDVVKYWEVRVVGDLENGIIPQLDNFRVAPSFLKMDTAFIEQLLSKDPHLIGYVPDTFNLSRNTVMNAVKTCGSLLVHLKDEFKMDRECVLAALENDGLAIQHVDEKFRDDREVALKAVRQNGLALKYVGEALKQQNDWEIIIAAIEQNPKAIMYAGERFFGNWDHYSASGDEHPHYSWHHGEHETAPMPALRIPEAIAKTGEDAKAILEIGMKHPKIFDYFVEGHPIWDNMEFVWGLIDKTNRIPKRIGMKLRNDPKFILTLLHKRSKKLGDGCHDSYVLFNYAGGELRGHPAFLERMLMFRMDIGQIAAWVGKDDFFVQADFNDLDMRR